MACEWKPPLDGVSNERGKIAKQPHRAQSFFELFPLFLRFSLALAIFLVGAGLGESKCLGVLGGA